MSDESTRSQPALAGIPTLICKACNVEKSETEFYMQVRDGYKPRRMRVCKTCHKARVVRNTQRYRREGRRPD